MNFKEYLKENFDWIKKLDSEKLQEYLNTHKNIDINLKNSIQREINIKKHMENIQDKHIDNSTEQVRKKEREKLDMHHNLKEPEKPDTDDKNRLINYYQQLLHYYEQRLKLQHDINGVYKEGSQIFKLRHKIEDLKKQK